MASQPQSIVKIINYCHSDSFAPSLRKLWNNSCYLDVTLLGKARSGFERLSGISVNKSILAAVSQKFACLLADTGDDVSIIFPETDIVVLKLFTSFVYSGEIMVNAEDSSSKLNELKSFFSDWDIQFPEHAFVPNTRSDEPRIYTAYSSPQEQSALSISAPTSANQPDDRPANFERLFSKTYTRKNKKPERISSQFTIILPGQGAHNEKSIDLEGENDEKFHSESSRLNNEEELIAAPSYSFDSSYLDVETNVPEDNFSDIVALRIEEKKHERLTGLLDSLTRKLNRYRTYAKYFLDSRKTSAPRKVAVVNNPNLLLEESTSKQVAAAYKPKRLPCKLCGKEISADYMAAHVKIHSNERSFLCEVCGTSFLTPDGLRKHVKFIHNDKELPMHTCNTCGKNFKKARYLKMHESLHNGLKPYKCPYCDKCFRLSAVLDKHKRTHTGEKPYECNVCHRRFSARTNYVVHLRRHGSTPVNSNLYSALYKCNVCGTTFHREYPYLTHVAAHNGEEPKLPCRRCPETFSNYKLVKKHLREKHVDELFMCDECPNLFTTATALRKHKATHKEGKLPRCQFCSRYFLTEEKLTVHVQRYHANKGSLACDICGKTFSSHLTLRLHGRVHNDERPYQCPHCPKAFRQDTHLTNHVRIHTGEKPFVCNICNKAFGSKNNLHVHIKIHTGQRNQCSTCGKAFRSLVKLREHELTHVSVEESGGFALTSALNSESQSM